MGKIFYIPIGSDDPILRMDSVISPGFHDNKLYDESKFPNWIQMPAIQQFSIKLTDLIRKWVYSGYISDRSYLKHSPFGKYTEPKNPDCIFIKKSDPTELDYFYYNNLTI